MIGSTLILVLGWSMVCLDKMSVSNFLVIYALHDL